METNTKVKRTQGEWKVIEQRSILEPFLLYAGKRKIATMHWGVHSSYPETFEEVEANVKFICEAVTNYDKLKAYNEVLLNALKVCGKMLDEKKRKVNARLTSYEWEIYSTVLKAIKQVESK